jgi:kynureninase
MPKAKAAAAQLAEQGVIVDAREGLLRLCPDELNSSDELVEAAGRIGNVLHDI